MKPLFNPKNVLGIDTQCNPSRINMNAAFITILVNHDIPFSVTAMEFSLMTIMSSHRLDIYRIFPMAYVPYVQD